jgi:hypothetical protein
MRLNRRNKFGAIGELISPLVIGFKISLFGAFDAAHACIPKYMDCNPGRKIEGFEAILALSAAGLVLFVLFKLILLVSSKVGGLLAWVLPALAVCLIGLWIVMDLSGIPSWIMHIVFILFFSFFVYTVLLLDGFFDNRS